MGIIGRRRVRRWGGALGVSAAVHLALVLILIHRQPHAPLVELPTVEAAIMRPPEPPPPEPKGKPLERPQPPAPTPPSPRPVESPAPGQTVPLAPAARPAPPAPPAPQAPEAAAPAPSPLRLGCEGRAFDRLSPAEQARCFTSLTAYPRGAGASPTPLSVLEKEIATEAAATRAAEAPLGTAKVKTGGCQEASMGVGCVDDRMGINIIKKKF